MSDRYKVEFFDRSYNFLDWSMIDKPQIELDYLTLDTSAITIPKVVNAPCGSYAHITNGADVIYQGIVQTSSCNEYLTDVRMLPLLSLFDVQVYFDKERLKTLPPENAIAEMISGIYINTDDDVQKVEGLSIEVSTASGTIDLQLDDNIHNLWDIIVESLRMADVTVSAVLYPEEKKILVNVGKRQNKKSIELTLPTISNQTITLPDTYGALNKVIFVDKEDENRQAVYYADHYTAPTVWTYEYISLSSDETWEDKCAARAKELFKTEYNSLIEFTAGVNDRFAGALEIGQTVDIYNNGKIIPSVLTAYQVSGAYKRYTFGLLRLEQTKIEAMQRRQNH